MTRVTAMGALALLASLSACGSVNQPAADQTSAAEMKMDGPFAKSEMDMDTAIRNAVGIDAADTWVKKMIAHHQGAIDMSRIVLGLQPTADVAKMAQLTIDNQGEEIRDLKALAKSGAPDPESAAPYQAAMVKMHEDMMAASGATDSETYLAKMLAHHRGAIVMSDIALANGATGAVRAQIEETRFEQQKEVAMVEAMQRGEPTTAQTPKTATAAAPSPAAKAVAPKAVAPKPAVATPAPAKSAPKPAPAPEASPTCAPEHREMGHC